MCWVLLLMRDATNAAPGGWREGLEAVIVEEIMPLLPGLLKEDELFPLWAVRVAAECLQGMPDLAAAALKRYLVRPSCIPWIHAASFNTSDWISVQGISSGDLLFSEIYEDCLQCVGTLSAYRQS